MTIFNRFLHSENALSHIEITDEGIKILSARQPEKAFSLISIVYSGISYSEGIEHGATNRSKSFSNKAPPILLYEGLISV